MCDVCNHVMRSTSKSPLKWEGGKLSQNKLLNEHYLHSPCINSNSLLTTVFKNFQWARRNLGYWPTTYMILEAMMALLSLPFFCSHSPSKSLITVTRNLFSSSSCIAPEILPIAQHSWNGAGTHLLNTLPVITISSHVVPSTVLIWNEKPSSSISDIPTTAAVSKISNKWLQPLTGDNFKFVKT